MPARATRSSPPARSLRPAQLGALASAGVVTVSCTRRPRVAVLATGNELRQPGTELAPGEIYESNSLLISALVASAGAEPTRFEPAADDERATRDALAHALDGADRRADLRRRLGRPA